MIKNETFLIRLITRDDITESYYSLLGQLTEIDPKTMDSDRTTAFFRNLGQDHQIYVIEHCKAGGIVATGTILIEDKLIRNYGRVGHIEDIVVDSDFSGYGLGKIMINYLTEVGGQVGCYKCILDCDDEHVGFYEKCGYRRKGAEMAQYISK